MVPNSSLKNRSCFAPVSFCATHWLIPDPISGTGAKPREVVIEGKAEFATNYKIRVITFSDYINWDPIETTSEQIARDGSFKLSFQMPTIQLIRLKLTAPQLNFCSSRTPLSV